MSDCLMMISPLAALRLIGPSALTVSFFSLSPFPARFLRVSFSPLTSVCGFLFYPIAEENTFLCPRHTPFSNTKTSFFSASVCPPVLFFFTPFIFLHQGRNSFGFSSTFFCPPLQSFKNSSQLPLLPSFFGTLRFVTRSFFPFRQFGEHSKFN